MKPHMVRLCPSAPSMHVLLLFPEMVLSLLSRSTRVPTRSKRSRKHQICLHPQSFSTHLLPCRQASVGSSPSPPATWKCSVSWGNAPLPTTATCLGSLLDTWAQTDLGDLPHVGHHTKISVLSVPSNVDEGQQAMVIGTEEHQTMNQMVVRAQK